ncbi:serine/threonine-protein kinase [Actinomadura spongiicola]|uniref:serine/threonine-protein kinase n=1 Tax=Actinomadura spongiicola TaxID=2303421 RepID=UPI001F27D4C1|nr:serine/threonine-protein kinase [Actinomadura spongiicola]
MPNEPTGGRLLARRYRLVTQVGRGGMGTVWQAHDEVLGRDVAVKEVILPHGLTDEERAVHHKRTFREARTAARLGHPGVVTVYDVVEEDDRPWIIMELIRARSLDQVIKQDGPLETRRAAEIGRQMLAALHAAHGAGVLHRDVKPSNVLITGTGRMGERAVLTDFGIATASGDATLTQTGLVMGSPAYIAPERARGRVAGPASDLWSLGVTLYAMLHGKSPFERPEPMAALVAVISEEPDPPETGGRLIPVVEGLLRKDPDERMDAIEAGALLDDIVRRESIDTQRTMAVEYSADDMPAEMADPGGRTSVDPVGPRPGPHASEARPDQLTSFDLPPATSPRSARSPRSAPSGRSDRPGATARFGSVGAEGGAAGPGETTPDPGRAATWRSLTPRGSGPAAGNSPAEPSGDGATARHLAPPTHPAGRPTLASNRNVLIVAVVALIVIVIVAGIALANSRGDGKPARKESAAPPTTGGSKQSAPPSSSKPSKQPADALPAGFTMHKDRSGYSVPVPKGWSGPERKQGGDHFYSPDRRTYLQIDQTDSPSDSALGDWRRQARGGNRFQGYREIRLAPTGDHPPVPDTGDGDDSADWEFTFDNGGGRKHILNRGFVAGGHGYAILLCAPEQDWDKVFAEMQPVYRFFKPAGD